MPDLEKVVKELESLRDICNAKSNMAIGKGKVAWAGYANTAEDALTLLKEQEAVKPEMYFVGQDKYKFYRCPVCKIDWYYKGNYCLGCGRPVKWE